MTNERYHKSKATAHALAGDFRKPSRNTQPNAWEALERHAAHHELELERQRFTQTRRAVRYATDRRVA
jgi:hypothetical protein